MYAQNGVWLMNRKTMAAVRKLKDQQDRYLFDANLDKDGLPTIQGRPVYDCPDMDDIAGEQSPILFGDLREPIASTIGFKSRSCAIRSPWPRSI